MFDIAQTTPDTADWTAELAVGDIVSYRFPLAEDAATGLPKIRPCLVLEVEGRGRRRQVVLAYGTTSASNANRGYEISLSDHAAIATAGLHRPTRFVCRRRIRVPVTDKGFVACRDLGTAVIGSLEGPARARMQAVRARIHAEHDIAVAEREERRRERAETAVPRRHAGHPWQRRRHTA